ncbi:hypothetical protein BDV33DRAFT_185883 [Aspergillus novoparasiticus]|uniref:Uncharacterized protein n=1 Tax=Aspergillus novoparasiticus TaxID=986946 RepID=A0A5N6E826_9EURO|nr:hypothetical protein BDV33DRAFT_185883 [Aspergillus novoparasiticus]
MRPYLLLLATFIASFDTIAANVIKETPATDSHPERLHDSQLTKKLPWIADNQISTVCFPGEFEKCKGSRRYCQESLWTSRGERVKYNNVDECLAARELDPLSAAQTNKPKLPWKNPKHTKDCRKVSEDCWGTELFCYEVKADNVEACLAQRERDPAMTNMTARMKWFEGTGVDCVHQWTPSEPCYGTAAYCQQKLYPKGRYNSPEDCLASRQPREKGPWITGLGCDRNSEACMGTEEWCSSLPKEKRGECFSFRSKTAA